ncbi:phosphatidylglycerophosphatase A [Porticoccaceae bacterium]|nr:phosphatidylglycerophosphatase A [Porticoccaceae bacterium]
MRSPTLMLAFGFGSGLSKYAPGTLGTIAAIPLWWLLTQLSQPLYLSLVLVAAIVGVSICGRAAEQLGVHDHGGIVWDEFVGLWVAMAFLPVSPVSLVLGFSLFRFFDIVKPWPISWLDKNISGGLGIMIDDIAAGLAAGGTGWLLQVYIIGNL